MISSPIRQSMLPLLSSTTKVYGAPRAFSTTSALLRRVANPTIPGTSIKIFRDVPALRQWRRKQLIDHRMVGLVPTMGALHEGHLSLIRLAAAENSNVIVSVYINPTQFGVHEDLDSYPKTWEKDCKMLKGLDMELADNGNMGKIAAVFAPTTETMYPSGPPSQEVKAKGSFITITPVGELLEGASRPTFFRGVATVCMKLFNIVMPDNVYFGQKDVQQTVVIKKMVKDFCFDTKVVIGETQREHDGLALSSRNVYLGKRRRNVATALSKMLKVAEQGYNLGHRSRDELLGPALELSKLMLMEQHQLKPEERVRYEVDYISLADPETMEEIEEVDETKGAILSGAIKMLPVEAPQVGEDLGLSDGPPVRLIDNIILKPVKV
ncbi:putative pantoate-beta-alanine ligase protein [Botrytis fragariae]|uniref:Pantoate--beta-alanine ligase n=1 Tax=Botrytis fragariae TaxID=1964551 RepID=A0A8H6ASB3_9HELO|nr:putative pantoate-beta-alanine ligase protein [Botrytis fragariae]KAF5872465.1 putative pantoate-beta-alanine ligase protein [Botrytis fragariae]